MGKVNKKVGFSGCGESEKKWNNRLKGVYKNLKANCIVSSDKLQFDMNEEYVFITLIKPDEKYACEVIKSDIPKFFKRIKEVKGVIVTIPI